MPCSRLQISQRVGFGSSLHCDGLTKAAATRAAYCAELSFPQNLTTSASLYSNARRRLEAAGFRDGSLEEDELKALKAKAASDLTGGERIRFQERQNALRSKFDKQKVRLGTAHTQFLNSLIQAVVEARRCFGVFDEQLGERDYFDGSLSALDAILYSRVAFLVYSNLPDSIIPDLLRSEFPRLVAHTKRVHNALFGPASTQLRTISPTPSRWWQSLRAGATSLWPASTSTLPASKAAADFNRKRLIFLGAAMTCIAAFSVSQGLVSLPHVFVRGTPVDDDDDDEAREL